jgi:hypothetical protein
MGSYFSASAQRAAFNIQRSMSTPDLRSVLTSICQRVTDLQEIHLDELNDSVQLTNS